MRSKVLAKGNLLRGGKRAEMAFVDFFGLDVEGEMSGQIALDRRRVVAKVAAIGLPIHDCARVSPDVGFVDAVVELGRLHSATAAASAAAGRGKAFLVRVILHVRHQWTWISADKSHPSKNLK